MGERLAFLCLGAMGGPMAGHLARAGHDVAVWNRTEEKARRWATEHGGRAAQSPEAAARGAAVVFACSGDDDALRDVATAAFAGMSPGSVFVDHTTVSAEVSRELAAEARGRALEFVDAPVSGGEEGARRGTLTVMAGGSAAAFHRVEPLLACYAGRAAHFGDSGAGQLAKMVNQICITGLLEALAEGLRFAERAGLDARAVVELIAHGAAGSWQMSHRAASMLERRFDFGFAVDWMRKDLRIALAEARRNGAQLPITAQVAERYRALQARGDGRLDTSSLIALLD